MPTNTPVDLIKKFDEDPETTSKPKMPPEARHRIYKAILNDLKTDLSFKPQEKQEVVDALIDSYSFKNKLLSGEKEIINQMASISTVEQLNKIEENGAEIDDEFAQQVLNNASLPTYKDKQGNPLNHKILLALANNINQSEKDAIEQVKKIIDAIKTKTYDISKSLEILNVLTDKLDATGPNFIATSKALVEAANKVNDPVNAEVGKIFDKVIDKLPTKKDFTENFSVYNGKLKSLYNQLNATSLTTLASAATEIKTIDELLTVDDGKITQDSGFVNAVFDNKKINKNLDKLQIDSLLKLAENTDDPKQLKTIVDNLEKQKYFDNKAKRDTTNPKVLAKLAEHATNAAQLEKIASAKNANANVFSAILNKAEDLAEKAALAKRNPIAKLFGYNKEKTTQYTTDKRKEIFGSIVSSIGARQELTQIHIDDVEKLAGQSLSGSKGGKGFPIDKLDILYPETKAKAPILPNVPAPVVLPQPLPPDPASPGPSITTQPTAAPTPQKAGSFIDPKNTGNINKNVSTYIQSLDASKLDALGLINHTRVGNQILNPKEQPIMEAKEDGSVSFPTVDGKLDPGQIKLFKESIKEACKDSTADSRTTISINGISEDDVSKILEQLKSDPAFIRNNVELTSSNQKIKDKIDAILPAPAVPTAGQPTLEAIDTAPAPASPKSKHSGGPGQ